MTEEFLNLKITPSCGKCGHNGIVIPDDPTDDSVITCESCGAEIGTHGQFQAHVQQLAADTVRDEMSNILKDTFKGSTNFKLK
jgi:ribosomal protein S27E